MTGLYIHIPFCQIRCPYCDFAFVVNKTHLADRYTKAVIREYETRIKDLEPTPEWSSLYFGGGTPTAIPIQNLKQILEIVQTKTVLSSQAEITAEANPGNQDRFSDLKAIGINRLSLGVQALDNRALKALGRNHTAEEALSAFQDARQAGFENISLDLIFGAPGQTVSDWRSTLRQAIELNPEHLSVYGLTIEPGTPYARQYENGRLILPPESAQAEMYGQAIDLLSGAGYIHYEISNFARPGFASQHNLGYWAERPYVGIGLSAHSFTAGKRSWNIRDLMAYIKEVEAIGIAQEGEEILKPADRDLERIMLGLRQRTGVSETLVRIPRLLPQLNRLLSDRLLEKDNGHLRLTRKGLLLADLVCAQLVKEL